MKRKPTPQIDLPFVCECGLTYSGNLPPPGTVVDATLKHSGTGKTVVVELRRVSEDNVAWRNTDDGSELDEWNWDVIGWKARGSENENS